MQRSLDPVIPGEPPHAHVVVGAPTPRAPRQTARHSWLDRLVQVVHLKWHHHPCDAFHQLRLGLACHRGHPVVDHSRPVQASCHPDRLCHPWRLDPYPDSYLCHFALVIVGLVTLGLAVIVVASSVARWR